MPSSLWMDVVVLALVLLVLLPLVCCAVYTPIQRESGMRVPPLPPSAPIYKWCEDDAGLGFPLRPWPDLPPTRSPIAQLVRAPH